MIRALCELIGLSAIITLLVSILAKYALGVPTDVAINTSIFAAAFFTGAGVDVVRFLND